MTTNTTSTAAPSKTAGYLGKLPRAIWPILALAWEHGIYVSSNLARENADLIGLAASMGWISTVAWDGKRYLRIWNVTPEGLSALKHREML